MDRISGDKQLSGHGYNSISEQEEQDGGHKKVAEYVLMKILFQFGHKQYIA